MTEIPANTNFQLTQALQQLSQAAPSSEVARQAIEVIVKQLEGNLISLNPVNSAQLKAALLPDANLQGQLTNGQNYQVKLSAQQNALLQFFATGDSSNLSSIPLSEPLTQLLLKLPAQQLNQLIATVLPQLKLASAGVNPNIFEVLPATVIEQSNKQLALNFDSLKITLPLNLSLTSLTATNNPGANSLSANQTPPLLSGDKVAVEINVKGKVWQLNIIKLDNTETAPTKYADQVILSSREAQVVAKPLSLNALTVPLANIADKANITEKANIADKEFAAAKVAHPGVAEAKQSDKLQGNTQALQNVKINLTPELAAPLIKSLLSEQASRQAIELPLPLKTLVGQLVQSNTTGSQELLNKILNLVPDKISLQIKASGEAALLIQHPKLVANLPLTAAEIDSLKPLKLSGIENLKSNLAINPTNTDKAIQVSLNTQTNPAAIASKDNKPASGNSVQQLNPAKVNTDKAALNPASVDIAKTAEQAKLPATSLLDFKTLQHMIESNPAVKSLITPQLLNNKTTQIELLQSLLRVSQPRAENASSVLNTIDKMLTEPANFKGFSEPETQSWLKQVSQEIKQALPRGNEQDASQIKQLLTTPSQPISTVQIISPPASQGMLSGLITLIQVSLAARLMRNQPSQAERIAQVLPSIFSDSSKTTSPSNPARAMQEFGQLEQRQQLMREIGKLLSEHQSNKLNNAEKLLQGQETFYYNLPTAFGGVFKNIELLIKREEQKDKQTEQNANKTQSWQLTMKLGVGELGELLTKAKLRPDELALDFYASNDAVLKQLMNFLPLLKRRLDSLGIEVTKSQCQLGKIPESLDQRSYHIFKAKA